MAADNPMISTSIVVADANEHTIEIYTGEDEQEGGNMPMYEKQTWHTGDVITEEKLNHMEDGIASSRMFFVGSTYDESTQIGTLDKTYKEIVDAFNAGQNVILKHLVGTITYINPLVSYDNEDNIFAVSFFDFDNTAIATFIADSENGYPSYEDNSDGGGGHN